MLGSFVRIEPRILIFVRILFEPFSISVHNRLYLLHEQEFAKSRNFPISNITYEIMNL